jgi:hypothetical protein
MRIKFKKGKLSLKKTSLNKEYLFMKAQKSKIFGSRKSKDFLGKGKPKPAF